MGQAYRIGLFSSEEVSAGSFSESSPLLLNSIRPGETASMQILVSGAGAVDVEILVSVNESTYVPLKHVVASATAGEYIEDISLPPAMRLKARVSEVSVADSATVSIWLCLK